MAWFEYMALGLFSALIGGSFGQLYRLAVRVPSWLFSD